jgi:REP element-mobilizing transposase RayT
MGQSLARNLIHLVYSTKNREPWIIDDVRDGLYAYQAGIFKDCQSQAIIIGGVADHVHALFALSKNWALADVIEEVKKGSSKWMKSSEGIRDRGFQWQAGYAAFSVSPSMERRVYAYIENQVEHHKKRSYQEELRALLKRHRIEFDERYLWE